MATVIRMPEVLAGSSEAAILSWLVKVGDAITPGVPLAEIETEKANVEYASENEGTVLSIVAAEGVSVKVGDPIAVVGAPGEVVDDSSSAGDAPASGATAGGATADAGRPDSDAVAPGETTSLAAAPGSRTFMSPLVRRLARERQLDLSRVIGTGPGGRIVRRDLDGLGAAPAAAVGAVVAPAAVQAEPQSASVVHGISEAGGYDVPHTGMRRAIARRLTESKSTVPHFYLVADCVVDGLIELRAMVNATSPVKISLNDFVLKAAAAAFVDVPDANATWGADATRRHSVVDMSVAVSIEGGLVTPVLRQVESMSLSDIARTVADLAERARSGRLKQHELEGGSFAVSNLGMYGVTEFSAIINPPQSAILAVGAARQQAIVVDGALAVGTVMTVTLSADHRVLDGALAAQWLAAFVRRIENPISMLV